MAKLQWHKRRPLPEQRADFRDTDRSPPQSLQGRADRAMAKWLASLDPEKAQALRTPLRAQVFNPVGQLERARRRGS